MADGMLPEELAPWSDEWYTLCERAQHVGRIGISGELAEAIVNCVSRLTRHGAVDADDRSAELTTAWMAGAESVRDRNAEDAARYRWLKENCQHVPDELGVAGQLYFGAYKGGEIDSAIDEAMKNAT